MSRGVRRTGFGIAATVLVLAGALVIWARSHRGPVTLAEAGLPERGDWKRAAEVLRGEVNAERGTDGQSRGASDLRANPGPARSRRCRLGDLPQAPGRRGPGTRGSIPSGLMHARAGRPEKAFDLWEQAGEEGLEPPELLDHLARLSIGMQRMDEAAEAAPRLAQQPGWEARGPSCSRRSRSSSIIPPASSPPAGRRSIATRRPEMPPCPVHRRLLSQAPGAEPAPARPSGGGPEPAGGGDGEPNLGRSPARPRPVR